MPRLSPSPVARPRLRLLTAGPVVAALVGLGVAVVPAGGANAIGDAALDGAKTTSTSRCTGCLYPTTRSFEKGVDGWKGTNGATVAVTDAVAKSGAQSLVIDSLAPGAGAKGAVSLTGRTNVSLSIMVEPAPAGAAVDDDATTLVLLTMTPYGGKPQTYAQNLSDGLWHSVGGWVSYPDGPVTLEVTLLQSCGSAIGRRLFVDDIRMLRYTKPQAAGQAAGSTEPTSSLSATTTKPSASTSATSTSTASSATSATSTASPKCVGSTEIPTTTTTTTTDPTTTTTDPTSDVKLFSFENGKKENWKGTQGTSAKIVSASAVDGSKVLSLKAVKTPYVGLTWTGRTSAFPGTGSWYHVVLPVRLEKAEYRSSEDDTAPEVKLAVSGPIASTLGDATVLVWDEWTNVDVWFLLDDTVGKKPAQVTLSLVQAPQRKCGAPTMLPTQVAVDAIGFTRTDRLPVTTQATPTKAC